MEIVKANSREPVANEGAISALIARCKAGALSLNQRMQEFEVSDLDQLSDDIIETSRRATIAAIAALPKAGGTAL